MRRVTEDFKIQIDLNFDEEEYDFELVTDPSKKIQLLSFVKRLLQIEDWRRSMNKEEKMVEEAIKHNNLVAYEILRQNGIKTNPFIMELTSKKISLQTFIHVLCDVLEKWNTRPEIVLDDIINSYEDGWNKNRHIYLFTLHFRKCTQFYMKLIDPTKSGKFEIMDHIDNIFEMTLETKLVIRQGLSPLPQHIRNMIYKKM